MLKTETKSLLFASLMFFLFLGFTSAKAAGLVPCGDDPSNPCTFDHLVAMVKTIIDFVLYKIVPLIAAITIVIAAINLMTSAGNPEKLEGAKKTLIWIVLGLAVAYGAWALVSGFVSMLGGDTGWTLFFFDKK